MSNNLLELWSKELIVSFYSCLMDIMSLCFESLFLIDSLGFMRLIVQPSISIILHQYFGQIWILNTFQPLHQALILTQLIDVDNANSVWTLSWMYICFWARSVMLCSAETAHTEIKSKISFGNHMQKINSFKVIKTSRCWKYESLYFLMVHLHNWCQEDHL